MQALAGEGMGPQFLAYVDKKGRPIWAVVIQLSCGLLAFVNEVEAGSTMFNWLLALTGLSTFWVWGSICLSHICFRRAWAASGRDVLDLPYRAQFGVYGSYVGLTLVVFCLIGTVYVALFPFGGSPSAYDFFQSCLAIPVVIALFIFWKLWTRDWTFGVKTKNIDVDFGSREFDAFPVKEAGQGDRSILGKLRRAIF